VVKGDTLSGTGLLRSGLKSSTGSPGCLPEDAPADRAIVILIFVLSLGYLWVFRRYTTMEPDEGIILQGAQRILRGEVLYRDFFSFFTPGSYYLLAFLFKLFGSSILVARTALVFFGANRGGISCARKAEQSDDDQRAPARLDVRGREDAEK